MQRAREEAEKQAQRGLQAQRAREAREAAERIKQAHAALKPVTLFSMKPSLSAGPFPAEGIV